LAADSDVVVAEDGGDAGFGDAIVGGDLLGGVAGFVLFGDVRDIIGA
jgi:hypothetical protein